MSEDFHPVWNVECDHANAYIEELEGEIETLTSQLMRTEAETKAAQQAADKWYEATQKYLVEKAELRKRMDDDCTDCATGVEKYKREQLEVKLLKCKWLLAEALREWREWGQSDHAQSGDGLDMPTEVELLAVLEGLWEEREK